MLEFHDGTYFCAMISRTRNCGIAPPDGLDYSAHTTTLHPLGAEGPITGKVQHQKAARSSPGHLRLLKKPRLK